MPDDERLTSADFANQLKEMREENAARRDVAHTLNNQLMTTIGEMSTEQLRQADELRYQGERLDSMEKKLQQGIKEIKAQAESNGAKAEEAALIGTTTAQYTRATKFENRVGVIVVSAIVAAFEYFSRHG